MLKLREDHRPVRCPLCRDGVDEAAAEALRRCAGCQTLYHASCFAELNGCATLGCTQRAALKTAPPPVTPPQARRSASAEELNATVGLAVGVTLVVGGVLHSLPLRSSTIGLSILSVALGVLSVTVSAAFASDLSLSTGPIGTLWRWVFRGLNLSAAAGAFTLLTVAPLGLLVAQGGYGPGSWGVGLGSAALGLALSGALLRRALR